jgi:hypothetical protein
MLYNIVIYHVVLAKVGRLTKSWSNEIYITIHIDEQMSDAFPMLDVLKRRGFYQH